MKPRDSDIPFMLSEQFGVPPEFAKEFGTDMSNRKHKRRHEVTDPNPMTLPVKFQRPPTLAEQIARFMAGHQRFVEQQGDESIDEAEDFDMPEDDSPESPHELVFDEQLNREMPRYEKMRLDYDRQRFDSELQRKIREDQKARLAAEAAARRAASKTKNDPPSSDSDDE